MLAIGCATPAAAQSGWMAEFSGGAATPLSDISSRLETGFGVNGGVGYQFTPHFNLMGEFAWANMTVPPDVLQQLQAPAGHGHITSFDVEPEFRFALPKHLGGFVHGGVGWIRRNIALTQPSVQEIDYYDPFYGDIPTEVASDIVLSSTTRNAFGGNIGGGVSHAIGDTGADVFVDVRYYYAPTSPSLTVMLPITFGIRYSGAK